MSEKYKNKDKHWEVLSQEKKNVNTQQQRDEAKLVRKEVCFMKTKARHRSR